MSRICGHISLAARMKLAASPFELANLLKGLWFHRIPWSLVKLHLLSFNHCSTVLSRQWRIQICLEKRMSYSYTLSKKESSRDLEWNPILCAGRTTKGCNSIFLTFPTGYSPPGKVLRASNLEYNSGDLGIRLHLVPYFYQPSPPVKIITNAGCSHYSLILEVHFIILHPPWNKPVIPLQEKNTYTFFGVKSRFFWSQDIIHCHWLDFFPHKKRTPWTQTRLFYLYKWYLPKNGYLSHLAKDNTHLQKFPTKNGNGYCEVPILGTFKYSFPILMFSLSKIVKPLTMASNPAIPAASKTKMAVASRAKVPEFDKADKGSQRVMEILLSNWIDVFLC